MPKRDNKSGSCTLIKPDGNKIEFKVDGHDVPYSLEHRTTAVPANIYDSNSMAIPAATPASQSIEDPEETGQGGPWLAEGDRARRDSKLRKVDS